MRKVEFSRFVRPDIRAMEPYVPIVPFDVLSQRLGRTAASIVKLDANESPYGPAPEALAALQEARYLHIYPDPESNRLREALQDYTGIRKGLLMAGAGADELIDLVLRAVLSPGDGVINCPPSFGMYPFSTAVNMGQLIEVRREADFRLNMAGIEARMAAHPRARVLFVCSPNNPDGNVISDDELEQLLALPLLVVLDEAYVEFSGNSRIKWVPHFENLVVLRTFSKWAGLAGLRVGYGAFPGWLMPHLWKIKQPYNVNVAASEAAIASLENREWLEEKVQALVAERERLRATLAAFDFLDPLPSEANFVLCRVQGRDAYGLKKALEAEGILVRYFAKPGLENCIRISAGRPAETERLLVALTEIAGRQTPKERAEEERE